VAREALAIEAPMSTSDEPPHRDWAPRVET
jgi:hypothetical protein